MSNYALTENDVETLRGMHDWKRRYTANNGINTPSAAAVGRHQGRRTRRRLIGDATLPSPQYQYMVGQGVVPNQFGFDWTRAANPPGA